MVQKVGILIAVLFFLDISFINAQQLEVLPKSVADQISRLERLLQPSVVKQSYALSQIFQKRIESLTDKANFYEEAKVIVENKFIKHSDEEIDVIITMVLDKSLNQTEKDIIKIASDLQHQNDTITKFRECIQVFLEVKRRCDPENENISQPELSTWLEELMPTSYSNNMDLIVEYADSLLEEDYVSVQDIIIVINRLKNKLDEMNEMSEMTSLRLQMTMDRRSKFISTLSQMMKKISTTQDILVQNIK